MRREGFLIFLTLVIVNLDFTKSKPHHAIDGSLSKLPVHITWNYFRTFSSFTQRQVSSPSFVSSVLSQKQPRVTGVSSNSINLGSLYAVIGEKPFDVETKDIVKALDASPSDPAANVFSAIQDYLNQDPHTLATNVLFTSSDKRPLVEELEKLRLYQVKVERFENSTKTAQQINAYVANHTENLIIDQLLPTQDVPFYSSTAGVLVNTLSAQYKFPTPFNPGPNMEFRVSPEEALSVETLEMASVLKYHEGRETVVVLPLENPQKRLILVKPDNFEEFTRKYLNNFVEYLNTISSHPLLKIQYFKERNVRVQVPILNLTLGRKFLQEYEVERKIESSTSAICDTATDRKYFLQTPAQVSTTRLSAKLIELAVAIGVQVDDVKEYRRIFGAVDPIVSNNNGIPNNTSSGGNNSFVSITELPAARLELDVSDGVAEPEPESEPVALADEAETSTMKSKSQVAQDTKTITKSKPLPSGPLADDTGAAAPEPEPESEPQSYSDDSSVAASQPEPEPLTPVKPIFGSKLRSELAVDRIAMDREEKIHVHIHSPLHPDEPMLFSRALDGQNQEEVGKDATVTTTTTTTGTPTTSTSATPVSLKSEEDDQSQINVVFDSPFYLGIFDESIGIYSFLAVRSPYAAAPLTQPQNPNTVSPSTDFSDYEKLKRWVCLAPPAPATAVFHH